MNQPIHRKTTILPVLIVVVLACFGLLTEAQAVVPAPDGGYPGANTAEGQAALLSLTSGGYNTAVGWLSLRSNMTGSFNTAVGAGALLANTGDQNTATGTGALLSNTSAYDTATGAFALFKNVGGFSNSAFGRSALEENVSGNENTATGQNALLFNQTGSSNTANGQAALQGNIGGSDNTAVGWHALIDSTGAFNTAVGSGALASNGGGNFNNAFGRGALALHTNGDGNVAVGDSALANHTTGTGNTAVGNSTLVNSITGDFNIALGVFAGQNITGNNNLDIGNGGLAGESDTIRIGNPSNTRAFIAGTFGVTTGGAAIPVLIDAMGQLGTVSSSRRFKNEIKPMDSASESILGLKPVTFHYKSDKAGTPQFGLIAEEVAAVNPNLVMRDDKGEIYTVRYDAVNAMLLNEFLKEHRKVEQQEATIAQLKKDFQIASAQQREDIQLLRTQLKEQAVQIQKVIAQLEVAKPAAQTVLNNP
ncbi:MAG TPA: tail fiber domain-containing protein [Candidatus Udaeobacter sp.]|nr:tail fiber domain-containing protein [Candidatus Udaeobacter sp.]